MPSKPIRSTWNKEHHKTTHWWEKLTSNRSRCSVLIKYTSAHKSTQRQTHTYAPTYKRRVFVWRHRNSHLASVLWPRMCQLGLRLLALKLKRMSHECVKACMCVCCKITHSIFNEGMSTFETSLFLYFLSQIAFGSSLQSFLPTTNGQTVCWCRVSSVALSLMRWVIVLHYAAFIQRKARGKGKSYK